MQQNLIINELLGKNIEKKVSIPLLKDTNISLTESKESSKKSPFTRQLDAKMHIKRNIAVPLNFIMIHLLNIIKSKIWS